MSFKKNIQQLSRTAICLFSISFLWNHFTLAQTTKSAENVKPFYQSEYIFPFQSQHVHSSCIVELPNGDLLSCWFQGSGERSANDVLIKGARLKKGQNRWSEPFVLADTPKNPDCNPILFLDKTQRLHLAWIVVVANQWESSLLKTRIATDYQGDGAPKWSWQDVILLKPGDEFAQSISEQFKKLKTPELAWCGYSPKYEQQVYNAAKDPVKREIGWMGRIKPTTLPDGRILLPLYSDGYNLSLVAISDDNAETWNPSLPIVGRGNVQPTILRKKDGTLVAYMRDNGDEPGRIMKSISNDNGYTWTPCEKTELPNPGSSVDGLVLSDGRWVLIYNDLENGRYRLVVSLSEDEGSSWKYTRTLENNKDGGFAYPCLIQTKDGKIHASYSYHLKNDKTIKHISFSPDRITE
jgi:predicted neuraminidase